MTGIRLAYDPLDEIATSKNPHYLAMISCADIKKPGSGMRGINVELQLPEQFNFSIQSEFNAPFAQGFMKGQIGDAMKTAGSMLGMSNFVTQAQTLQVWQGSTTIDFTLTFELYADTDPYFDVVQPIKDLLFLMLPGLTGGSAGGVLGGLLKPPGPSINLSPIDGKSFDNEISLTIGSFLRFDSVVITAVEHNFESSFNSVGLPTFASVNVAFKTFRVMVREEIDKLFISQPSTGGGRGLINPNSVF